MKPAAIFLLISAIVFLSFSCNRVKPVDADKDKPFCLSDTMRNMVTIDSASICPLVDELNLSGEVNFDGNKVAKIFPRSGGQLIKCNVSIGDKVEAGEVIAVIKSADIAGSYADMSVANADLAIAKRDMDNKDALWKSGIASQQEYEEAKQNYEKALAGKSKIQSSLDINGGSNTNAGGSYTLTSPISGYLVEKNINEGNFIREDMSDNLFTVSDMRDVWVSANVFETDIPRIKDGLNVRINTLAYPDKFYTGIIEKSSEVLDPVNKVMKIRVRLENPNLELKPGMFANVTVTNEIGGSAVCIPSSAIVQDNGKSFVIIYNSDCDLKVQEIFVLKTAGSKTYIKSGLDAGQKMITKNAIMLYSAFTDK